MLTLYLITIGCFLICIQVYFKFKSVANHKKLFLNLIEKSKIEIPLGPLNWTETRFPHMDKPLCTHWLKQDVDSMYNILLLNYWFKHLINDCDDNETKYILLGCIARASKYALQNEFVGWTFSKLLFEKKIKGKIYYLTALPNIENISRFDGHRSILFIDDEFNNNYIIDAHDQTLYVNCDIEQNYKRIIYDGADVENKTITIDKQFVVSVPISLEFKNKILMKLLSIKMYLDDFAPPVYNHRFNTIFTNKLFGRFLICIESQINEISNI